MNNEMNYKALVSRYVDDEVTSQERDFIEQKLKEDKSLYAYYEELKQLDQLLHEHPVEEVSYDWERKVQSSLNEVDKQEGVTMPKKLRFDKALGGGAVVMMLIACLIGLQTYAQRGIQGRIRSATDDIGDQYSSGNTGIRLKESADDFGNQYEPYYLSTSYDVGRSAQQGTPVIARGPQGSLISADMTSEEIYGAPQFGRTRGDGGYYVEGESSYLGHDRGRSNTEEYARIYENEFLAVTDNPLSTFSIDVDTGSYSNIRRFLNQGQLPPEDAVRIEEMINYFTYDYPQPKGRDPFSINIDAAACPWNRDHQLVRIGLQGKTLTSEEIPPSNLVFLIDVSGSMQASNKLPLLKTSLKKMVKQLSSDQRVAIVTYSDRARMVLASTSGSDKRRILGAIDRLSANGSTAGKAGITMAYQIAKENYIEGGNNRVIISTDGDFNVDISSTSEMVRLIEDKRQEGIYLTMLGFGTGNYKDHRLEQIANKGNGTYHYIDGEAEAEKVLVDELGSTLFTIAKDVKLQVEFNPAQVEAYRLLGYENRVLAKQDFNDDSKDAGELGAGHTVTALYEVVPAGSHEQYGTVDSLTYQKRQRVSSNDLMTVKLRYKDPDGYTSKLIQHTIGRAGVHSEARGGLQFAAAVAEFGLLLRNSQYRADADYDHVIQAAEASRHHDPNGHKKEFIGLVKKAKNLDQRLPAEQSRTHESYYDENEGSMRFKND